MAFVKGDLAKLTGLVKGIQQITQKYQDKGFKSFVVYLGGPESKEMLTKFVAENKITIPVAFLPNGQPPASYKINPEAESTVLVYHRNTVVANFVNVKREDGPKIVAAVESIVK